MKTFTTTEQTYTALVNITTDEVSASIMQSGEVLHYPTTRVLISNVDVSVVITQLYAQFELIITEEDFNDESISQSN